MSLGIRCSSGIKLIRLWHSTLAIAVTDHTKENDPERVMRCIMSGLDKEMQSIRDLSPSDWDEKVKPIPSRQVFDKHLPDDV